MRKSNLVIIALCLIQSLSVSAASTLPTLGLGGGTSGGGGDISKANCVYYAYYSDSTENLNDRCNLSDDELYCAVEMIQSKYFQLNHDLNGVEMIQSCIADSQKLITA